MAIKSNWKKDCGKVVTYRVKEGVELNVMQGPVGPQIDLNANTYLPDNSSITQYDLFNGMSNINRMDFIEYISGRRLITNTAVMNTIMTTITTGFIRLFLPFL